MNKLKNKVLCMDALDLLKQLPDKSIDLVLTDPPYGIGNIVRHSNGGKANQTCFGDNMNWNNKIPSKEIFNEIFRVSKNQIIWGGNYFIEQILINSRCWLVWDKNNDKSSFADCELAWTSFDKIVKKYKYTWHGMLQENMKNKDIRVHPTQKPLALFRVILEDYNKNKGIVLDPFAGSFTTAKACQELGIDWICCDKEKKYCDLAKKRLAEKPLFVI